MTVTTVVGGGAYSQDTGVAPADERLESSASDGPDASGDSMTPEQKRSYARLFARTWLPVLLLLIIFVVLLMVVTRHLRLWVLGRRRPVKFKPVDDVWWHPPADKAEKKDQDDPKEDGPRR